MDNNLKESQKMLNDYSSCEGRRKKEIENFD